MRDSPPVVGRGEILLAVELLAREHIPQPEFSFEPSIRLLGDTACDQRLRVDDAPIGKARHGVAVRYSLGKGPRIDRREKAAALQIAGDDSGNVVRDVGFGRCAGQEVGQRDRHRLHVALRDVDTNRRGDRARQQPGHEAAGGQGGVREQTAAAQLRPAVA